MQHKMPAVGTWGCHYTCPLTLTEFQIGFKGEVVVVMPRIGRGNNMEARAGLRSQIPQLKSSATECRTMKIQ